MYLRGRSGHGPVGKAPALGAGDRRFESCCPDIETTSSRGSFFVGLNVDSELNPHDEDVVGLFLIALPSSEFGFELGFLERQAIVA